MQTTFNYFFMIAALSLSQVACAENTNIAPQKSLTTASSTSAASIDWEAMSYDEWDKMLQVSKKCPAKFDGHAKRFIGIRRLNDTASILGISCELGAYQDGKLLYILKDDQATPFFPILPKFEEDWYSEIQEIVWGGRYTEGDYLVLENRFAGSGECGYRALYLISDVISQKSPKPEKVYGDANCQDGVFLDDWPLIENFK